MTHLTFIYTVIPKLLIKAKEAELYMDPITLVQFGFVICMLTQGRNNHKMGFGQEPVTQLANGVHAITQTKRRNK